MPDCVDATEAGGLTSAPLVIEALETSPNGDVRYLVVEDLTLGATDALAPAGPWSDGVSATLTLSGTGASYVAADVVAWHPVVGSIDSARVQGYTLQAEVTGGAGTAAVAFSRVDLAADAAMVSFWQLGEGTYTVQERVPPSAWGAPIAIDNARTLTGTASVAFDVGCDQVLSSASPAADFVYLSLWEADGDMWGVMVPPSSDVTLPVLLGFGPAADGYYFEVDLVGAAYLDVGDDSSLPNPPRSRHERFGTVDLQ